LEPETLDLGVLMELIVFNLVELWDNVREEDSEA
jgi:hypothetical protein